MSKPAKTFIVTSSQMVEVVKTWEITVPDLAGDSVALAYDIAEECDELGWEEASQWREQNSRLGKPTKFDINHVPVEDIEIEWAIEEIDGPDEWGNEPGSPMYGVPPEGDPFWKENDQ